MAHSASKRATAPGLTHCVLRPNVDDGWRELAAFAATLPFGAFYLSRDWLRGAAEGIGQEVVVHAAVRAGRIAAAAVVREDACLGLRFARKPWATAYTGPFAAEGANSGAAAFLLRRLARRYGHVRLVMPPGASLPEACRCGGWGTQTKQTPVLDLGDVETLWKGFDRRVRQRVRKARELGVTVRESGDAGEFHGLHAQTYASQGLPMTLSPERMQAALGPAMRGGALRILAAYTAAGDAAAGLVVGADAARVYFVLAGSHPVHRKTDAMTLLWWEALREAAATRREADLVGCGLPSVDRFKDAFRPRKRDHWDLSGWASGLRGLACRGMLAARNRLRAAS